MVTTLIDPRLYTRDDLAELYHRRWLVELDIRAIKDTLGMDILRCKTPEMVRREMWTCLLGYNLIRQTILNSARQGGISPRQISFTAAMQKIAAGLIPVLLIEDAALADLVAAHLHDLPRHKIGHRPNRMEPRANKRRPKMHKLLTKPRNEARAELLAGKA